MNLVNSFSWGACFDESQERVFRWGSCDIVERNHSTITALCYRNATMHEISREILRKTYA